LPLLIVIPKALPTLFSGEVFGKMPELLFSIHWKWMGTKGAEKNNTKVS